MTIRFAFQLNVFIIVVLFLLLLLFYLVLFFLMELLHDLFHKMPYWQEVFQLVFCWSVWRWEAIIRRKAWKTTSNFRALLKILRKYDCFNCFGYMVWMIYYFSWNVRISFTQGIIKGYLWKILPQATRIFTYKFLLKSDLCAEFSGESIQSWQ